MRMRAGEPINVIEASAYAYPPAMAFLTTFLTFGPIQLGAVLWYLINIACGGVLIVRGWSLAGGPPLVGMPRRWLAIFAIAMLLNLRYTIAPLQHQQFDLVIAACVVTGGMLLGRGRDRWAGVWLGIAAAMKCTPLIFAPYLIWRRKFVAAGLLVAWPPGSTCCPMWSTRSSRAGSICTIGSTRSPAWRRGKARAPGTPSRRRTNRWPARSPAGPARRGAGWWSTKAICRPRRLGSARPCSAPAWACCSLRCGVAAGRFSRPRCCRPTRRGLCRSSRSRSAWRWHAGVCLMLLLSPMTGKAHFAIMLLPCFLVTRALFERRSRALAVLFGLICLCGPLTTKGVWGKELGGQMLFWGLPTFYVVAALASLWIMLGWRIPRPPFLRGLRDFRERRRLSSFVPLR